MRSLPTRRPPSRPGVAAIPRSRLASPARCGVNDDYDRGGAVAYLAAYDVHRAKVFGRCEQTTGIEPFRRLVQQVMTAEPYASADRVFWIVDNGLLPPWPSRDRPAGQAIPERDPWCTPRCTPPG